MNQKKNKCHKYNLTVKGREYTVGDQKKNEWLPIGRLNVFTTEELPEDMSIMVELNHMPGQKINCYPKKVEGEFYKKDLPKKEDEGISF